MRGEQGGIIAAKSEQQRRPFKVWHTGVPADEAAELGTHPDHVYADRQDRLEFLPAWHRGQADAKDVRREDNGDNWRRVHHDPRVLREALDQAVR